ncbi:hypothetical protein G9A89_009691 [Geosiphon pyriformis]|nr:hypothetical protein G9A89_009691 [Geosiphon pyriformis]
MSFELGLMVVFELWMFDKLFVAVAVDILLVAAVNKLEIDIQVVDILAVALLADDLFITRLTAWAWLALSSAASKSQVLKHPKPLDQCLIVAVVVAAVEVTAVVVEVVEVTAVAVCQLVELD